MIEHCMTPELQAEAEELADKARCDRCGTRILDEASAVGSIFGLMRTPLSEDSASFLLCGKCGLCLHEFLDPSALHNSEFQTMKAELMVMWS